jgi:hypothetical protein
VRVIAIDPGTTTGWVLFVPVHRLQLRVIDWGETRGATAFGRWLNAQQRKPETMAEIAVVENWIPYTDGKRRSWEPDPLHVIGMVRLIFGDEATDLGQVAADAHQWGTEGKIAPYTEDKNGPRVGKGRGAEGHAVMALRHGLRWTANVWNGMQ